MKLCSYFGRTSMSYLSKNRIFHNLVMYLHDQTLISEDSTESSEKKHIFLESTLLLSVFVISIFVSIIDLQAAFYFWLVIIPAKIILPENIVSMQQMRKKLNRHHFVFCHLISQFQVFIHECHENTV